jgi:uncharacterized integral membrane protein
MKWFKFLLLAILFLAALFFSMHNMDPVTLRFGLYPLQDQAWLETPQFPLFLAILLSILLGIIIGGSADFYRRFQLKRMLRRNQKTIERLEKEVQSLRTSGLNTAPRGLSPLIAEKK